MTDPLIIAGKSYNSRLIVGTGKYQTYQQNADAARAAGAEIVTVALRRVNLSDPNEERLTDFVKPDEFTYLPNTAGCYTADEAVRTLRLAREAGGWNLVKLEVLADQKTLYPNMPETLEAAKALIADGFEVMVYCSDDPVYAKMLEDAGCCAIMPLGSLIGSGLGIMNPVNIRLIVEQTRVPVIVDAGVGTASDAAIAMELGCDGVLMNTAIAAAKDPIRMANAMKHAHGFDEQDRVALFHLVANADELLRTGFRRQVYRADHRRLDGVVRCLRWSVCGGDRSSC